MANMSYCRFQNTLGDFRDCVEEMKLHLLENSEGAEKLSYPEWAAMLELFSSMIEFMSDIGVEYDDDFVESIADDLEKLNHGPY